MKPLRNLLLATALVSGSVTGCRAIGNLASTDTTESLTELTRGAASVVTLPVNPLGWIEIASGLAGLAAAAYGGPKAYKKYRAWRGGIK